MNHRSLIVDHFWFDVLMFMGFRLLDNLWKIDENVHKIVDLMRCFFNVVLC